MTNHMQNITESIKPLKAQLINHDLYKYIESPDDLRIFTEHHIFAVWDFMSLLKNLQQKLSCVNVPWTPESSPEYTYFINEMVLTEEADINIKGERQSHFKMYLEAMQDIGASTHAINKFIEQIQHGTDVFLVISTSDLPESVKSFLIFTFNTIYREQSHQVASAFTFGREALIPDMFTEIISNIENRFPDDNISKLKYYFDRHIKIDADEYEPLAMELIGELCGNNSSKWKDAQTTAKNALEKRVALYDGILKRILYNKAIA